MESRHWSSSKIKGSNISRADSSDDVTLDFLMLKWSSCETNTWFKEIQRKTWTVTVKSRWRQCYLKAGVHQDVHAGPAADRRFPATSLGGREEEQAAGGRQSGVRWRLSQGFLSADGNVKDIVAHGKAKQKKKVVFSSFILWYRSLLVSSGRLSLTRPWHSSKMSWEPIPSLVSRPKTTRRSTAATRLQDFKLDEFSRI